MMTSAKKQFLFKSLVDSTIFTGRELYCDHQSQQPLPDLDDDIKTNASNDLDNSIELNDITINTHVVKQPIHQTFDSRQARSTHQSQAELVPFNTQLSREPSQIDFPRQTSNRHITPSLSPLQTNRQELINRLEKMKSTLDSCFLKNELGLIGNSLECTMQF